MPTEGCSVHMPIIITNSKLWGAEEDSVPYMLKVILTHINKVDPAIKFTVEGNQQDGGTPFLGTIVKPEADNTLSLTDNRKPTH